LYSATWSYPFWGALCDTFNCIGAAQAAME